jgi:hypothetical protein
MPTPNYGLAVSSFDTSHSATGTFDNFSATTSGLSLPAPSSTRTRSNLGTNFWVMYHPFDTSTADGRAQGNLPFLPYTNFATHPTSVWNPTFLAETKPFQALRYMDWNATLNSPNKDWLSRTQRWDVVQTAGFAVNNTNFPSNYVVVPDLQTDGRATAGVAYEWQVDLCNQVGSDMWTNVPELAIDPKDFPNGNDFNNEYVLKQAILIKTGVDMKDVNLHNLVGGTANLANLANYTAAQFVAAGGVQTGSPLSSNQKLYVEYANELWQAGGTYWMNTVDTAEGFGTGGDYESAGAWCECRAWQAFKDVFGNSSQLVFVAGTTPNNIGIDTESKVLKNSQYNPWGIMPNVWKIPTYFSPSDLKSDAWQTAISGSSYSVTADESTDTQIQQTVAQNLGSNVGFVSYEGGQSVTGNGADIFSLNPQIADVYNAWFKDVLPQFSLVCHYTLYGSFTGSEAWGAKQYTGEPTFESYKYQSMLNYIGGN